MFPADFKWFSLWRAVIWGNENPVRINPADSSLPLLKKVKGYTYLKDLFQAVL